MLTNQYLFPLTTYRAPTPGWYVSADRWVLGISLLLGAVVYLPDRHRTRSPREQSVEQSSYIDRMPQTKNYNDG